MSISASVSLVSAPRLLIPAALTKISGSTSAAQILAKHSRTSRELPMSQSNAENGRPSALTLCSSDGCPASTGSWTDTTSQPASARVIQSSLPMPPVDPVHIAVLPSSAKSWLMGKRVDVSSWVAWFSDFVMFEQGVCGGETMKQLGFVIATNVPWRTSAYRLSSHDVLHIGSHTPEVASRSSSSSLRRIGWRAGAGKREELISPHRPPIFARAESSNLHSVAK